MLSELISYIIQVPKVQLVRKLVHKDVVRQEIASVLQQHVRQPRLPTVQIVLVVHLGTGLKTMLQELRTDAVAGLEGGKGSQQSDLEATSTAVFFIAIIRCSS